MKKHTEGKDVIPPAGDFLPLTKNWPFVGSRNYCLTSFVGWWLASTEEVASGGTSGAWPEANVAVSSRSHVKLGLLWNHATVFQLGS